MRTQQLAARVLPADLAVTGSKPTVRVRVWLNGVLARPPFQESMPVARFSRLARLYPFRSKALSASNNDRECRLLINKPPCKEVVQFRWGGLLIKSLHYWLQWYRIGTDTPPSWKIAYHGRSPATPRGASPHAFQRHLVPVR